MSFVEDILPLILVIGVILFVFSRTFLKKERQILMKAYLLGTVIYILGAVWYLQRASLNNWDTDFLIQAFFTGGFSIIFFQQYQKLSKIKKG